MSERITREDALRERGAERRGARMSARGERIGQGGVPRACGAEGSGVPA